MAETSKAELQALRASKFEAAIDLMADPEAGQYDVAKAIVEYGSACFMHGKACAR